MRCNRVKKNLGPYLDKELINKKAITLIERHLQRCSRCRAELHSLTLIKELLSQKERLTAKDDFLLRLKSRLKPETQTPRIRWVLETGNLARRLIPVTATIMILVTALMLGRQPGVSPINNYMFGGLSNEEMGILNGDVSNSELLTKMIFNDQGGDWK